MRKRGRVNVPITDLQRKAVEEYYKSELSMIEVAEKYGTTQSGLRYWIKKYKAEVGEPETKKDGDMNGQVVRSEAKSDS